MRCNQYIVLKRSNERRKRIVRQHVNRFGVLPNIFDAVDGQLLSDAEKNKYVTVNIKGVSKRKYLPGEIGCTMSHIKVLQYAKEHKWPYVVVFEDDVIFAEDIKERVDKLFDIVPDDWEHIYLGVHVWPGTYTFLEKELKDKMHCISNVTGSGTWAMIIRNMAYDKIINKLFTFCWTTDGIYSLMVENNELQSYLYYPTTVYTYKNISTTRGGHKPLPDMGKVLFKNKM